MSSNYHILCLSHDPALTVTSFGHNRPEEAEAAVREDTDSHARCDLLIARHSGALVELGCPSTYPAREGAYQCGTHSGTEWVDVEWLRLLAVAYQSDDQAVRDVTAERGFRCWPWERLLRLREELGFAITPAPAPAADAVGGTPDGSPLEWRQRQLNGSWSLEVPGGLVTVPGTTSRSQLRTIANCFWAPAAPMGGPST
ncbi:hypothetical protein [Streptomyces sp. NPDC047070]|uniref:hypothetical protein n=1 Tax=Streptomyces sp. NPDC047070 TaxID=3154923 RepID=UPI0034558BD5